MKANLSGRRLLRSLVSMSLPAVAGLAVLILGPGTFPTFGIEGAEVLAFSRPAAPAVVAPAQQIAANSTEATVLANWEFTADPHHPHDPPGPPPSPAPSSYGDATNDVQQALQDVNQANKFAGQALLAHNPNDAQPQDMNAVNQLLKAYNQLADAAGDARSLVLAADAQSLWAVYIKMNSDAQAGNGVAVFQDSQAAQTVVNRAVLDASPFR